MASFTDEELSAAVEAHRQAGGVRAAARHIGCTRAGMQRRLKRAAERGLMGFSPVLPGYAVKSVASRSEDGAWVKQTKAPGEVFTVSPGQVVKGVSALVDPEGREVLKWVKTGTGAADPAAIVEILRHAFDDMEGAAEPAPSPSIAADDILTLTPCNDWHVGMFAWGRETGENWDLKIAEAVIGRGIEDLVERSPASGVAVVLGGGDLLHADNKDNQTARSGNVLDVDGRYAKVMNVAQRLMVKTIDAHLRRHARVIVRVLKGNHDEHSAIAIAYYLAAWYRNEPRVVVDTDPSDFWWHRFGKVLFGSTHGHTVKITDMPSIMAHRRAEDWGATKFRYVHGFHLHHSAKFATEGRGVISEVHQAPIPQDAWHFGSGFLSGRSLQSITYHRDFGEVSRTRVAILDAANDNSPKLEDVA